MTLEEHREREWKGETAVISACCFKPHCSVYHDPEDAPESFSANCVCDASGGSQEKLTETVMAEPVNHVCWFLTRCTDRYGLPERLLEKQHTARSWSEGIRAAKPELIWPRLLRKSMLHFFRWLLAFTIHMSCFGGTQKMLSCLFPCDKWIVTTTRSETGICYGMGLCRGFWRGAYTCTLLVDRRRPMCRDSDPDSPLTTTL